MKDEKETRKRLQECAMEEFLEKGFMKASLRSICKKAGVTTGALYFFFEDKDDLFASLVQEPLAGVREAMERHFMGEKQAMEAGELFGEEAAVSACELNCFNASVYDIKDGLL